MEEMIVKPCLNSGFCCTKAPCAYGEWNLDKSACKYLLDPNAIGQKLCGKYDWIKENVVGWKWYPAFGEGCCSSMNTFRAKIKETLDALGLQEETKPFKITIE